MLYIKIIKLGFAGSFKKRFVGEQKMGTRVSGPYWYGLVILISYNNS